VRAERFPRAVKRHTGRREAASGEAADAEAEQAAGGGRVPPEAALLVEGVKNRGMIKGDPVF